MSIFRNHNAPVAACYACLAGEKALAGEIFAAAVYGAAALVHMFAARDGGHDTKPQG